jgi:hypothetical protein
MLSSLRLYHAQRVLCREEEPRLRKLRRRQRYTIAFRRGLRKNYALIRGRTALIVRQDNAPAPAAVSGRGGWD